MKRMKASTSNRKGLFPIYDIPDRKAELYRSWGYYEVDKDGNKVKPKRGVSKPELANDKTPAKEAASEVAAPEVPLPTSFNVSDGNWFQIRGAIKEALNVDDLPKSKAGVIEYLESRGFEVIE